jgi:flagellar biosynthesis GTPase FlhF
MQTKTYRGRSLEELLPRIREELGADAIVMRQREGLMGGVAGFFQRPFVEVEAVPAPGPGPRFDAHDDDGLAVGAGGAHPLDELLAGATGLAGAESAPSDPAVRELLAGALGSGVNGHGLNGHAVNGHGVNGHGLNGHAVNGHGANGHGVNGHGSDGGSGARFIADIYAAGNGAAAANATGAPAPVPPAPAAATAPIPASSVALPVAPTLSEASAPPATGPASLTYLDAATAEGLSSSVVQAMIEQAAPFAAHLDAAVSQVDAAAAVQELTPLSAPPEAVPAPAPQPVQVAAVLPAPAREATVPVPAVPPAVPAPPAATPASAPGRRPRTADTVERTLVEHGVGAELAASLVGEAVSHLLPFGTPQQLKRLVRASLARRIPAPAPRAAGGLVMALAGPGGAGKTLAVSRLAAAYAAGSDLSVTCVALRPRDGGAELRELTAPHGVDVVVAANARDAASAIADLRERALVLVDTPAVSPASEEDVKALGSELRRLGADEVHVLVPATMSAAAARGMLERYAPLRACAIAITHADETDHLGGALELAIAREQPISYVCQGSGAAGSLLPADPVALAGRVLP